MCPTDRSLIYLYVAPATCFGINRAITGQTESFCLPGTDFEFMACPKTKVLKNLKNPEPL